MESAQQRRAKRKSPCPDLIFELNEGDLSPDHSDNDSTEPGAKILKTKGDVSQSRVNETVSNLESDQVKDSGNISDKDSTEPEANILKTKGDVTQSRVSETVSNLLNDQAKDSGNISDKLKEQLEANKLSEDVTVQIKCDNPQPFSNETVDLEEGEVNDVIIIENGINPTDLQNSKVNDVEIAESEADTVNTTGLEVTKPCISVKFSDEKMSEIYKFKFLKFIQSFVELEIESYDNLTINVNRDINLNPSEWVVLDDTLCMNDVQESVEALAELPMSSKKPNVKKQKKKKPKKDKELFVVDVNPSLETTKNNDQPKYSSKFLIDEKKETEEVKVPSNQTCFNCDKDHSLKDCPEPKNYNKINLNRQKFSNKNKTSRYHLEEDQKYSHLKPGKISANLRKALGLKKSQVPKFIYQMRNLGYPPGWLEEAKFVHSNLAMFDIHGQNVKDTKQKKSCGLDSEKIVDYCGFNVPLDEEFKDEYKYYHTPPYSEDFSKQKMIEYFEKNFMEKQDILDFTEENCSTLNGQGEKSIIENRVTEIQVKEIQDIKNSESNVPSPSLNDLEKAKETLLAALNTPDENSKPEETTSEKKSEESECPSSPLITQVNSAEYPSPPSTTDVNLSECPSSPSITQENLAECPSPSITQGNSSECPSPRLISQANLQETVATDKNLKIDVDIPVNSIECLSSPLSRVNNSVVTSSFGTPILKSSSPYSRLPNPDNFSKDVSPVINFENLPNSTGTYEQMTGVLQKVRNTLKHLQNCST